MVEQQLPEADERHERERSSLRRELVAILFLYLAQVILPLLIGLGFGAEAP